MLKYNQHNFTDWGVCMKDFSKNEWGLVLAGGGGKGAYQVGVFRALREHGIDNYITAVSGVSVGALNLILFAYNDQKMAEDVWKSISPRQFLEVDPELIDFKEGLMSRDGLSEILDNYIDMEIIRKNERTLYVALTEVDADGKAQNNLARYFSLNYQGDGRIRKLLLASSALPIIYEPVEIDGKRYKDGGLKDNLPIAPLYAEGMRHFIVVGLSPDTKIDYERFPDAEFVFIKPGEKIGGFGDGTLDFTSGGARVRMETGYLDAMRELEFSDKDMNDENNRIMYEASAVNDYNKIVFDFRKVRLENEVGAEMDKINNLINKYT